MALFGVRIGCIDGSTRNLIVIESGSMTFEQVQEKVMGRFVDVTFVSVMSAEDLVMDEYGGEAELFGL